MFTILSVLTVLTLIDANPLSHTNPFLEKRIINGTVANTDLPWFAHFSNTKGDSVCGGTFIAPTFILTAAHCMLPFKAIDFNATIVSNSHTLNASLSVNSATWKVVNYLVNPGYDRDAVSADIALIQVKQASGPTAGLLNFIKIGDGTSKDFVAYGFGLTNPLKSKIPEVMRKVKIHNVAIDSCMKENPKDGRNGIVTDMNICAAGSGTESVCDGDSGGGLASIQNGETYLEGISSWVHKPCGTLGKPSVFTKVSSYHDWIDASKKSLIDELASGKLSKKEENDKDLRVILEDAYDRDHTPVKLRRSKLFMTTIDILDETKLNGDKVAHAKADHVLSLLGVGTELTNEQLDAIEAALK